MGEAGEKKRNLNKTTKLLSFVVASAVCLILLTVIVFKIYLASSLPAPQFSRFVTYQLQQGFTVKEIQWSGRTLILKGVRLENPPGFTSGELASADTLLLRPQWLDLLRGEQRFHLLSIEGGRVELEKNKSGAWNFSQLQRRLAERKPRPAEKAPETLVKKLLVKDGVLTVQGQAVRGINLQIFNLASAGSRDAQLELAFEDATRNRYALKGTARPGKDAAVDLSLSAPSLSLKSLQGLTKLKDAAVFKDARGALQANAVLVSGELRSSGIFRFSGVQLPGARAGNPFAGALEFKGSYSLPRDTAQLEEATLTLDQTARLYAEGSVRGVKEERDFALLLRLDGIDLALLNALVPAQSRSNLLFGGRLRCDALLLKGSGRAGLRSAEGRVQLEDGSLASEGKVVVTGLSGKAALSRKGETVAASGRLTTPRPDANALIETLDLPFDLTLSSRMKPLRASSGAVTARVMGVPLAGRVAYDVAGKAPLSATVVIKAARLADLNHLLRRYNLTASSGVVSGNVDLAAKSAQDLSATASLRLSKVRGVRGKDSLGADAATVTARVRKQGRSLKAQGYARLEDFLFNGKSGDARFAYRVLDRKVYLDGLQIGYGPSRLSAASLVAQLPAAKAGAQGARHPLLLDVEGGSFRQGELQLAALSGRFRGSLVSDGKERWLEGTADLRSRTLSWQGSGIAAPVLQVTFSRPGARGDLSGQLLGGKLAGSLATRPAPSGARATFDLGVTGAVAAQTARFLPKGSKVRPTGGLIDLHLAGAYSGKNGVACRFESKGRDIALANEAGKALLSGASASLQGQLSQGTLSLTEASLAPGPGVALQVKGELARAFSDQRHGTLQFSLPETSLNALVESLINLMPRIIQEATLAGTVAAKGQLELGAGQKLLEGGVSVKGGRVEVPSQKLVLAEVNGRIPVSLDFGGKGGGKPRDGREFSRENYPRLLRQLRDIPPGGDVVTVDKVTFGTMEWDKLALQLKAGKGLVEIASLRSALYEGALLGTGYLTLGDRFTYRGDLLVNGLSMRALCGTIPNLQGYISGRVDGVVSVRGQGADVEKLTGFVDLWAREGEGEKMLVSREFLQRLAKQKLSGFFLSRDRPYDKAELKATLEQGDLTFNALTIVNTNFFGVRDLNVTIAPTQNRIALDHLLASIREAALRGTPTTGDQPPPKAGGAPEIVPEFKWEE